MTVQPTKKKPVSLEVLTKLYSIWSSTQFFSQAPILSHTSASSSSQRISPWNFIFISERLYRESRIMFLLSVPCDFFCVVTLSSPATGSVGSSALLVTFFAHFFPLCLLGKERIIPVGTSASSFLVFWTPFLLGSHFTFFNLLQPLFGFLWFCLFLLVFFLGLCFPLCISIRGVLFSCCPFEGHGNFLFLLLRKTGCFKWWRSHAQRVWNDRLEGTLFSLGILCDTVKVLGKSWNSIQFMHADRLVIVSHVFPFWGALWIDTSCSGLPCFPGRFLVRKKLVSHQVDGVILRVASHTYSFASSKGKKNMYGKLWGCSFLHRS